MSFKITHQDRSLFPNIATSTEPRFMELGNSSVTIITVAGPLHA
jgi:hypothetical protein